QTPSEKYRAVKPQLILQTGYSDNAGATRLVFSADGRLLATTTFGSEIVKLWETATGRELRNLATGSQSSPSTSPLVAFSRNNLLLATTGPDNSIEIWDVISGRQLRTLSGATGIRFISFGGADRMLVTIGNEITVWDVSSGRELRKMDVSAPGRAAVSLD